jgi:hypothetical protein
VTKRAVVWFAVLVVASAAEVNAQVLVSAYGGGVHTRAAEVRLEQPALDTALTFPRVPFRSESLEPPIYYGYRIGLPTPRTPWLFIEAELIHAKIFAQSSAASAGIGRRRGLDAGAVPFASTFDRFGISHGMNFVLVNALVRRPITTDARWSVTGRIGVGPMVPHPEIAVDGEVEERYQFGGLGAQVSGGLEREIVGRLSAVGEYKFTLSRLRVAVHDGTVRLTTYSHHLALGLGLRF